MPRAPKPLPETSCLNEMFSISDEGRLVNKISRTSRRFASLADENCRRNYRTVFVEGRLLHAHRVIWKMVHGCDPNGFIDHINGDTCDNRPSNLREATHAQNMRNTKIYKHNTSGIKGVHQRRDNSMWRAYITVHGKRTHLGQFSTKEEAKAVLDKHREKFHGEFARAS